MNSCSRGCDRLVNFCAKQTYQCLLVVHIQPEKIKIKGYNSGRDRIDPGKDHE